MDSVNDGSLVERPRRIEILNGAERRRRWSDEGKARIVVESVVSGAVVSQVARRHDVLLVARTAEHLPDRIAIWQERVHERCVHHRHLQSGGPILRTEVSSEQQRHANRFQIIASDYIVIHRCLV